MPKLLRRIPLKQFSATEVLLIASSIGGSIASIVFQQVAFAAITSIPLSLAVSFNSYSRKRLDEANQQQGSAIQVEQQFLKHKEFVNEVIYSLPNRSELAGIESLLESRNAVFTEQLGKLKEQVNTYLELQKVNNKEVSDLQQRLRAVESLIQPYNPSQLHTEWQETQANIEGKIKKLEKQFYNLPISNLQYQVSQIEELVKKLQVNVDTNKTCNENKLLYTYINTELQVLLARAEEKIKKSEERILRQQLNSVSNNALDKSTTTYSTKTEVICEHCHQPIKGKYVVGSYFNNYKFHIDCKREYERKHGLL